MPKVTRSQFALCLALLVSGGCRTRPFDLAFDGEPAGADFAGPRDLSVPPDFSFPPDLIVIPDLLPPPDLTPPHHCDGIFVFQKDQHLAFFDPKQLVFQDIGRLNCPVLGNAEPFSMAVDRQGIAWVEYTDGNLFRVDTYTAQCEATQFVPGQSGIVNFGMGFAAEGPGSPKETLFIAGSNIIDKGGVQELGSIDLNTLLVKDIGPLFDNAELTGTGAGELWGFFASVAPHYGRIDKVTAKINPDIATPQLADVSNDAFAFGAFGGVFYVFLSPNGGSTTVYRLDPAKQTVAPVLANTGRTVVGAGVSTCAPQK